MTAFNLNKGGTPFTVPITLPPGSAANPPLQWTGAGIGIYQVGTAAIGFAIAGVNVGTLSATGLTLPGTLAVTGAISFDALTVNSIAAGDASLDITGLAAVGAVAAGALAFKGGLGSALAPTGGAITVSGGDAPTLGSGAGGAGTFSGGAGGGSGVGGVANLAGGTGGTAGDVQLNSNSNIVFPTALPTAATDAAFFVATRAMVVKSVSQIHSVAAGGTSTLTVIKDTGTAVPGGGTVIQQGSFNLNATANTVQSGTLAASAATLTLAAGDRLSVKFANAIQASAGIVVTVGLMPA